MGEAKKRGTLEERKALAEIKNDSLQENSLRNKPLIGYATYPNLLLVKHWAWVGQELMGKTYNSHKNFLGQKSLTVSNSSCSIYSVT